MRIVLVLQALASLNLMGLIGCIQWIHYPMFARLDKPEFAASVRWHGERITWLVGPWMLLELICSALLYLFPPWPSSVFGWGLGLVAALWLSTGLLQVPLHSRLSQGYDPLAVRRLVASNWLRTLLWSGRGLLSLYCLVTF